jgi:hypothetical protein
MISGVIDFGMSYSDQQAVRLGVREGGRRAAVATTGSSTSCNLTFATVPNADTQRLTCLVKNSVGFNASRVRVKVMFADPATGGTGAAQYTRGKSVIVCAMAEARSLTGIIKSVSNFSINSKAQFRIEQVASIQQAEESPLPGRSWSFCTSTAAP